MKRASGAVNAPARIAAERPARRAFRQAGRRKSAAPPAGARARHPAAAQNRPRNARRAIRGRNSKRRSITTWSSSSSPVHVPSSSSTHVPLSSSRHVPSSSLSLSTPGPGNLSSSLSLCRGGSKPSTGCPLGRGRRRYEALRREPKSLQTARRARARQWQLSWSAFAFPHLIVVKYRTRISSAEDAETQVNVLRITIS
jgi:hypothetical protein